MCDYSYNNVKHGRQENEKMKKIEFESQKKKGILKAVSYCLLTTETMRNSSTTTSSMM
jgi:hypothetical protein